MGTRAEPTDDDASRGTVAARSSLSEETNPGNKAQDLHQIAEKIDDEAEAHGGGLVEKAKAALHHADREWGGEYERREDPDAVASSQAIDPEQPPHGERETAHPREEAGP